MADLTAGLGAIYGLATGTGVGGWVSLGINLVVSTIVMGIVLMVLLEIISKAWGEPVKVTNAFLAALVINIINLPILSGLLVGFIAMVPFGLILVPLVIWIVLMKVFFGQMSTVHAVILGIIGFVLSIYLIPNLVGMVLGYLGL